MIMRPTTCFCPFARGEFEPRRVETSEGVEYTSGQCHEECALAVPVDRRMGDEVFHGWRCGLAAERRGYKVVTEV